MGSETLSLSRIKEVLDYNPGSGVFLWKKTRSRYAISGAVAGCVDKDGYRIICIDGRNYRAHRLAFLYMTGSFPRKFVDHKNRDRLDNRWCNLREVGKSKNAQNSEFTRAISGLRGAHWDKNRQKWQSRIRINGVVIRLGRFETAELAHLAYCEARKKYHPAFEDQQNRKRRAG